MTAGSNGIAGSDRSVHVEAAGINVGRKKTSEDKDNIPFL